MDKTEFDLFCDWVKTALPKHQVHSAFQVSLRSLLSAEFPHTTAIPEVYAVAGGRNDMVQYAQDGNPSREPGESGDVEQRLKSPFCRGLPDPRVAFDCTRRVPHRDRRKCDLVESVLSAGATGKSKRNCAPKITGSRSTAATEVTAVGVGCGEASRVMAAGLP